MTEVTNKGSATTNAEPKLDTTGGKKALKGFLLWGIVISGYLLFCFNWMVMDNMKGVAGQSGWYGSFFANGDKVGSIADQAPNWTLTFMRGVGAFLAGWLLVKIGHKHSVTIAISLLAFGGILGPLTGLIAVPDVSASVPIYNEQAHLGMFILFLILRMMMAVGATTLIVYTQPIIASYFNDGQKSKANLANALAFNVGSILAIALLTLNADLNKVIIDNWIVFTSCVSLIAIILLILWLVFAETIASPNDTTDSATYGSVLKEKRTWMYAIMFGLWLTWVVLYLTMVPAYFLTPVSGAQGHSINGGITGMWKILFLAGLFAGIPMYNWANSHDWARKPIAMGSIIIGVVLTLVTALIGAYGVDSLGGKGHAFETSTPLMLALFYITSFAAGMFAWGVQGYMLGTTYHYKGATPKKQGVLLGACWGIGYMGETVATIFLSVISPAKELRNVGSAWMFMVLFIILSFLTAVMWLFIDETHGKRASKDSLHYVG